MSIYNRDDDSSAFYQDLTQLLYILMKLRIVPDIGFVTDFGMKNPYVLKYMQPQQIR